MNKPIMRELTPEELLMVSGGGIKCRFTLWPLGFTCTWGKSAPGPSSDPNLGSDGFDDEDANVGIGDEWDLDLMEDDEGDKWEMDEADNEEENLDEEEEDFAITDAERELLENGDYRDFWESRKAKGDPVAEPGLASLNADSALGVFMNALVRVDADILSQIKQDAWNALSSWDANPLKAALAQLGAPNIDGDLDPLRAALIKEHIKATEKDIAEGIGEVPGLLSAEQISEYHRDVFEQRGLEPWRYGGSLLPGFLDNLTWCQGCDKPEENEGNLIGEEEQP